MPRMTTVSSDTVIAIVGGGRVVRGKAVLAYGLGGNEPGADGTVTQEAIGTYGWFRLSPLHHDEESKRSGFQANAWFSAIQLLDFPKHTVPFVVWNHCGWAELLVHRNDARRVLLLAGDIPTLNEETIRAAMMYPWGPAGIGIDPTVREIGG